MSASSGDPMLYAVNPSNSRVHIALRRLGPLDRNHDRLDARLLSDSLLSDLKDITVTLNASNCMQWPDAGPRFHPKVPKHIADLVYEVSDSFHSTLSSWELLARRLQVLNNQRELNVILICDTSSEEVAERAVAPLRKLRLRSCAIRLHPDQNPVLIDIANSAARDATSTKTPELQGIFRFHDLPFELRERILSLTGLVVPAQEVEWRPKTGFMVRQAARHHARKSCLNFRSKWPDVHPEYPNLHVRTGCFCTNKHASLVSCCKCWNPPQSLLLVDKRFRQEAEAVFFAQNKFVILPSDTGSHQLQWSEKPVVLPIVSFLDLIVHQHPQALRNMRKLALYFQPSDLVDKQLLPVQSAVDQLRATAEALTQRMDVTRLTLEVSMSGVFWEDDVRQEAPVEPPEAEISETFATIASALSPLGRAGLYRMIPWLLLPHRFYETEDGAEAQERIERRFGTTVMGDETYDSTRWAPSLLHLEPFRAEL